MNTTTYFLLSHSNKPILPPRFSKFKRDYKAELRRLDYERRQCEYRHRYEQRKVLERYQDTLSHGEKLVEQWLSRQTETSRKEAAARLKLKQLEESSSSASITSELSVKRRSLTTSLSSFTNDNDNAATNKATVSRRTKYLSPNLSHLVQDEEEPEPSLKQPPKSPLLLPMAMKGDQATKKFVTWLQEAASVVGKKAADDMIDDYKEPPPRVNSIILRQHQEAARVKERADELRETSLRLSKSVELFLDSMAPDDKNTGKGYDNYRDLLETSVASNLASDRFNRNKATEPLAIRVPRKTFKKSNNDMSLNKFNRDLDYYHFYHESSSDDDDDEVKLTLLPSIAKISKRVEEASSDELFFCNRKHVRNLTLKEIVY